MKNIKTITIILLTFLALSACSVNSDKLVSSNDKQLLTIEDFSGPYAQDFLDVYQATSSQIVLDILKDSEISSQELVDIKELQVKCMADEGYELVFHEDGGESVTPLDGDTSEAGSKREVESEGNCNKKTAIPSLQMLYQSTHYNPEKLDTMSLVVKCLVRERLVPEGYTVDEYKYDFGFFDGEEHGIGEKFDISNGGDLQDIKKFTDCNVYY